MSVFQLHPPVYALAARRVIDCQFGIFAGTKSTFFFFLEEESNWHWQLHNCLLWIFTDIRTGTITQLPFFACFSEHMDILGGAFNCKSSTSWLKTVCVALTG